MSSPINPPARALRASRTLTTPKPSLLRVSPLPKHPAAAVTAKIQVIQAGCPEEAESASGSRDGSGGDGDDAAAGRALPRPTLDLRLDLRPGLRLHPRPPPETSLPRYRASAASLARK